MNIKLFYDEINVDKSAAERLGFNPYYPDIESGLDDPIIINGNEYINLASNNYLGLASDERVKAAIIRAVEKYGASLCGTPIATGCIDLYKKLQERLAGFTGVEDVIIYPSGYQANCGLFPVIAGKEDLVIVDHYAHASLIHGIKSAGCKIKPFLHNNIEHLRSLLEASSGYRRVFAATESVFSTSGSIAHFDKIAELCRDYNAIPVIDDSHGIGVIGGRGRGILEYKGISNFQGIYTASLGKALANCGGIVGGGKKIIDYLRYSCSGLIYSTAVPPAVLGGIEKVLDIIESEFDELSGRMWKYKKMIAEALRGRGFELIDGEAPITSIKGGDLENTIRISKSLFESGILSTPFVPPSVPPVEGRVRLIAGANLKEDTIENAVKMFKKINGGFQAASLKK